MTHPLLQAAAVASRRGKCHREIAVAERVDPATLIEGTVDLAFEDEGGYVVVDYKTDPGISNEILDAYRRQVRLYVSAIARSTGQAARGVILRI
jgi:ATP-dependent helicase/nuclease subunit A